MALFNARDKSIGRLWELVSEFIKWEMCFNTEFIAHDALNHQNFDFALFQDVVVNGTEGIEIRHHDLIAKFLEMVQSISSSDDIDLIQTRAAILKEVCPNMEQPVQNILQQLEKCDRICKLESRPISIGKDTQMLTLLKNISLEACVSLPVPELVKVSENWEAVGYNKCIKKLGDEKCFFDRLVREVEQDEVLEILNIINMDIEFNNHMNIVLKIKSDDRTDDHDTDTISLTGSDSSALTLTAADYCDIIQGQEFVVASARNFAQVNQCDAANSIPNRQHHVPPKRSTTSKNLPHSTELASKNINTLRNGLITRKNSKHMNTLHNGVSAARNEPEFINALCNRLSARQNHNQIDLVNGDPYEFDGSHSTAPPVLRPIGNIPTSIENTPSKRRVWTQEQHLFAKPGMRDISELNIPNSPQYSTCESSHNMDTLESSSSSSSSSEEMPPSMSSQELPSSHDLYEPKSDSSSDSASFRITQSKLKKNKKKKDSAHLQIPRSKLKKSKTKGQR